MAAWTPIGERRCPVVVEANSPTTNDLGETIDAWTEVGGAWAKIENQAGRELYLSRQVQPDATAIIKIPYYHGLTTKHRIKYGDRIFDIQAVNNVEERNREHWLTCREST
jgi:SPP1 family predicted phage head-tail adaptor